jgi:hypothetical protein
MKVKANLVLIITTLILNPLSTSAQDSTLFKIGGALRYTYSLSSWKDKQIDRGGDVGFDVFLLNAKAKHKNISLDAEYRFYSKANGGQTLKYGFASYQFDVHNKIELGVTQVPFGITTYNSSGWFYSINYYVGLEEDYDMGIKYSFTNKNWNLDFAFFKNAEQFNFGDNSDLDDSRYSYDISSIKKDDKLIYRNKEINQLNLKSEYKTDNKNLKNSFGISGQYGLLYNLDTEKYGNQYAFAIHYKMNFRRIMLLAQATHYNYSAKNPENQNNNQIAITAYGAPSYIASRANTYTLGLSYNLPLNHSILSEITFYNDFGFMDKIHSNFKDSYVNSSGVLLSTGAIFIYVDYSLAKNHSCIGNSYEDAFSIGDKTNKWESALTVNIGYYF